MNNLKNSKKKRMRLGEQLEAIDAMGQDSERKAAKWVIEKHDEAEKIDKAEKDIQLETLTKKRRFKIFSYIEQLTIYMAEMLRGEEFPDGYHWSVEILDHGIKLEVFNRSRSWILTRKLKVVGEPKYDLHACMVFAYWAGDQVYKKTHVTDNGIIVPGGLKNKNEQVS